MSKKDEQFSSIEQLTAAFQEIYRNQVAFQEQSAKDHQEQLDSFTQLREDNRKAAEELREENRKATEELREDNRKAAEELREENRKATEELREENRKATEELRNSIAETNSTVKSLSVYSYAERAGRIENDLRHETLIKKLEEIKAIVDRQ